MSFLSNLHLGGNGSKLLPPMTAPEIRTSYLSDGRPVSVDFADEVWSLGWCDGKEGQPWKEAESVFLARAQVLAETRRAELGRELAQSQAKAAALREQATAMREELAQVAEQASKVSSAWLAHPSRFSITLGVLLLAVSFVLFASDVPLSLKLVAEGFNIDSATDLEPPLQGEISTSHLLRHPVLVLGYLWEPLLLAFGIAFAGVLLKVFLDDGFEPYEPRVNKKMIWLLTPAVLLLVASLVLVAWLRGQRSDLNAQTERGQAAIVFTGAAYEADAGGDVTAAEPAAVAADSPDDPEALRRWVTFWAFLSLTVTLPLVGGVLFSAGWTRVQNGLQVRRLRRLEKTLRLRLTKTAAEGESLGKRSELLGRQLQEGKGVPPEGDLWRALHRHGYLRGALAYDARAGQGFYPLCERLFSRALGGAERLKVLKTVDATNVEERR